MRDFIAFVNSKRGFSDGTIDMEKVPELFTTYWEEVAKSPVDINARYASGPKKEFANIWSTVTSQERQVSEPFSSIPLFKAAFQLFDAKRMKMNALNPKPQKPRGIQKKKELVPPPEQHPIDDAGSERQMDVDGSGLPASSI